MFAVCFIFFNFVFFRKQLASLVAFTGYPDSLRQNISVYLWLPDTRCHGYCTLPKERKKQEVGWGWVVRGVADAHIKQVIVCASCV